MCKPADELDVVGVARKLSFYLLRREYVQVGLMLQNFETQCPRIPHIHYVKDCIHLYTARGGGGGFMFQLTCIPETERLPTGTGGPSRWAYEVRRKISCHSIPEWELSVKRSLFDNKETKDLSKETQDLSPITRDLGISKEI